MKKFLSAVIAVALFSSFSFAESASWNLGLGIGYAMPSMEKVNKSMDDIHVLFPTTKVTKITSALDANIDLMYQALWFLQIGPRVGLVKCTQGSITGGSDYMRTDSILIPAQIGASIDIRLKDFPVGIIIEGFGGYGFSFHNLDNKIAGNTSTAGFSGGAPVYDILGGIEISPLSLMTIKVTIGYKIANITSLKATADSDYYSIKKGDELKNYLTDTALPVDYSGLNFKAGVSFKF